MPSRRDLRWFVSAGESGHKGRLLETLKQVQPNTSVRGYWQRIARRQPVQWGRHDWLGWDGLVLKQWSKPDELRPGPVLMTALL